jgi:exodeoxyribonuclease VII small subunit
MSEDKQSFEAAMNKLEQIVSELERGDFSLEESLAKFEEGLKLGKACRAVLDKADAKVKMLVEDVSGEAQETDAPGDL